MSVEVYCCCRFPSLVACRRRRLDPKSFFLSSLCRRRHLFRVYSSSPDRPPVAIYLLGSGSEVTEELTPLLRVVPVPLHDPDGSYLRNFRNGKARILDL